MAEFTPITTQEEFNAAIGERIKREKETISQKYSDYEDLKNKTTEYEKQIGELNRAIEDSGKKYADYDKNLADLQAKLSEYESSSVKTRIAHEIGIPYELAGRLSGKTEDEIRRMRNLCQNLLAHNTSLHSSRQKLRLKIQISQHLKI